MAKKFATAEEPAVTAKDEATYTVDEFVAAGDAVFEAGTSPDIIRAAFRVAGITSATVAEAKKLVKAFAEKEVK